MQQYSYVVTPMGTLRAVRSILASLGLVADAQEVADMVAYHASDRDEQPRSVLVTDEARSIILETSQTLLRQTP